MFTIELYISIQTQVTVKAYGLLVSMSIGVQIIHIHGSKLELIKCP